MALQFHPRQGSLVLVRFDAAFKPPEMVKARPCVVISPRIKGRANLLTVVALSTTRPDPVMPYHYEIDIDLDLPARWRARRCWVKGDMVYAVGFHRADLFSLGKGTDGRRIYQTETLPEESFSKVQACVLAALGLGA